MEDRKLLYTGIAECARSSFIISLINHLNSNCTFLLTADPKLINVYTEQLSTLKTTSPNTIFYGIAAFPEEPPPSIEESIRQERNSTRITALIKLNQITRKNICVVATPESLFGNLPTSDSLNKNSLNLEVGHSHNFLKLIKKLTNDLNYYTESSCQTVGELAIRGGIIDIFPLGMKKPYRIDFYGDEIESIRTFDPLSQRSLEKKESLLIYPNIEDGKNSVTIFDHLPNKAITWIFDDPHLIEREHSYRMERNTYNSQKLTFDTMLIKRKTYRDRFFGVCEFDLDPKIFLNGIRKEIHSGETELESLFPQNKNISKNSLTKEIKGEKSDLDTTQLRIRALDRIFNNKFPAKVECILSDPDNQQLIIDTIEFLKPLDSSKIIFLKSCSLKGSYILPCNYFENLSEGKLILTEENIIGRKQIQNSSNSINRGSQILHLLDFSQLVEGDLLIHLQHGLCRYKTICELELDGVLSEVITVEFDQDFLLHVPIREAHLLTRYLGISKRRIKLARIGTNQWVKTRTKAEHATLDYASRLLKLNAERASVKGYAFPEDHPWQEIFEKEFIYTETPDQLLAIEATKKDMESYKPMDRLICGDVGYGKTEVAIRAAFKAVLAGKQVAILVPTTVLCQQHLITFKERFKEFPVNINSVSSFNSVSQNKKYLEKLKIGEIDLIIGTHRLLSKDVEFNNLGLLVVDEEQRFGVKQKEAIKSIACNVDILTLTATPIPRTLHLSLSGARSMSIIESPPQERKPITTIVKSYNIQTIKESILYEYDRGGQVFYLHNNVATIENVAAKLKNLLPNLKIEVGHGQMNEGKLENIMVRFIRGEFDVLVCTTIIESGIDIPNCNTLIIEGADRFGLSQLYQIRGRVGRFNRQAYAYLFLHRHISLVKNVQKRLSALKQYNQLGAGFKIAMRDLELRGAGNILGAEQSGHVSNIGFELYCQLLKASIDRLSNKPYSNHITTDIYFDFIVYGERIYKKTDTINNPRGIIETNSKKTISTCRAYIPRSYINESSQRIHFYRSFSLCKDSAELHALKMELIDRFGKLPSPLNILLKIHIIRTIAQERNIKSIKTQDNRLICTKNTTPNEYYKIGSRFPRLTQIEPKLKLSQIHKFIKNITA